MRSGLFPDHYVREGRVSASLTYLILNLAILALHGKNRCVFVIRSTCALSTRSSFAPMLLAGSPDPDFGANVV